jgi:hypothetical protein
MFFDTGELAAIVEFEVKRRPPKHWAELLPRPLPPNRDGGPERDPDAEDVVAAGAVILLRILLGFI